MKYKQNKARTKHKLNMLHPGTFMCKVIGLCILISIGSSSLKAKTISSIFASFGAIIFIILIVLVTIELKQDSIQNMHDKNEPSVK